MTEKAEITTRLQARLAELSARVTAMDSELHTPLSADFEEQATDLEGQDALAGIEQAALGEIRQIEAALQRLEDGSYGICTECGTDIAPARLTAQPTATRCIRCAR